VSPALLQRQAALVGAALLAGLLVVVLDRPEREAVGAPPPASVIRWESAVVWVADSTDASACGTGAAHGSGVVHPVLPCGVDLVVSAHGRVIRTEVVGRGPAATGRDFALTPALADELGVRDGDRIRWRFAG
jgi:hypothetical protein